MKTTKRDRVQLGILAALKAAGVPVQVKQIARTVGTSGRDQTAVPAAVAKMLRQGDVLIAPGQMANGKHLPTLYVMLPGCTAPIPVLDADPCEPPPARATPERLAPVPEPEPVQDLAPEPEPEPEPVPAAPVAQTYAPETLPLFPDTTPSDQPVMPETSKSSSRSVSVRRRKLTARDGVGVKYHSVSFTPEAYAAFVTMLEDTEAAMGFRPTASQLCLRLFKLYSEASK